MPTAATTRATTIGTGRPTGGPAARTPAVTIRTSGPEDVSARDLDRCKPPTPVLIRTVPMTPETACHPGNDGPSRWLRPHRDPSATNRSSRPDRWRGRLRLPARRPERQDGEHDLRGVPVPPARRPR